MKKSTLILAFIILIIFGLGFILGLEFDHVFLGIKQPGSKDTNTPFKLFSTFSGIIFSISILFYYYKKAKAAESQNN
jgi:hypothetical protein